MGLNEQTRLEAFWTDAAVRQATVQFKQDQQDDATGSSSGVASPQQKDELHDDQEQRAKIRESMEQAGQQTPSPDGQLDRLDELEKQREQAEPLFDDNNEQ